MNATYFTMKDGIEMIVKYVEFLDDLMIWYRCECGKMKIHMCNGGYENYSTYTTFDQVRAFNEDIIHDDGED